MKLIKKLYTLLILITLTSCGELFTFEDAGQAATGITMSHHEVDILVGDSLILGTMLEHDTVKVSYYWSVYDNVDAIELIGRRVYAKKPGRAKVVVEAEGRDSLNNILTYTDSCYVNVFEWKNIESTEFLYETVLYASLTIDDELLNDSLGETRLVAVVDDEARGEAVMRKEYGIPYLEMRIYASWPGEKARIECYHRRLRQHFVFENLQLSGGTYGTLSNLRKYNAKSRQQ